ncbi:MULTISPECIES: YwqH-like family protein [Bacillus]|uniref:Uncharacterized protein n=2 Tax=Bacillus TaxID=1386 RepID=A0A0M4G660_9BACI|nr:MULTISPECIES: DUF5082 family protein [Bacillus]ALC80308.1 hypothetical protein AM592_00845 [Bacillus gobiensis]MBP1083857.1 uncharacterized protein YPO0396 [Bacillus capparidis]MED1098339.1 DUF5082 family protein [Bacillus capparidis]
MFSLDSLVHIRSAISGEVADVEEKIDRLNQAKKEIEHQQNDYLGECRKILKPELAKSWTGSRANKFNDSRDEAHQTIENILNHEYESYKDRIDWEIAQLNMQKETLSFAGILAREAVEIADAGQDAWEAAGDKFNDLKRWLF